MNILSAYVAVLWYLGFSDQLMGIVHSDVAVVVSVGHSQAYLCMI